MDGGTDGQTDRQICRLPGTQSNECQWTQELLTSWLSFTNVAIFCDMVMQ